MQRMFVETKPIATDVERQMWMAGLLGIKLIKLGAVN